MSLGSRIAIGVAVVLALTLFVLGFVMARVTRATLTAEIDDRGMQEVLRAVPGEKLLLAMKGADDELKAKIFKNMSQRAAEMLKDDLESRGPVRLSEVEAAQKEILAMVRKMAEAGTVQLGGKGEQFV